MGYAYYDREDGAGPRGYSVPDVCHYPDCTVKIDRGLAYLCYSCTGYFCLAHLTYADQEASCFAGKGHQCCDKCAAESDAETDDESDVIG